MITPAPSTRDAFAPGLLFSLAFVFTYTVPYLNLVDYSDVLPPPGARMASLAALGLLSYLAGLAFARRVWPTAGLAWPRVESERWRSPAALVIVTVLALASLGVLAIILDIGAMIPLLEHNKEAARWAFTAKVGHPINAATRLPITAAIACGLYVLASRRGLSRSNVLVASLVVVSMAAEALLGHRGLPIFILAPLVVCFHYLVRPIRLGVLVAAGALIILGLGIANYLRLTTSPPQLAHLLAHSNLPQWVPPALTPAVTFVAFSPLTFNLVLSMVPEREPFQYGAATFNGAFGILPGHQATISEFVTRRLLHLPEGSPGLPPTILGGFYLDFGRIGIVVGMVLVAIVSQYLYWRMFERSTLWSVFFYAYWSFNLFVALYGDLIANDLIWFIPLSVFGIHAAIGAAAGRKSRARALAWQPAVDRHPASAQELRERLCKPLVPLSGDERATMDRVLEHYRHLPVMVWWRVPELILLRRVAYQWPLLDLGCGDGRMAEVMFGRTRRVTLGLDLSQKDTGRARRSGSYESVIRGDLCGALPIRDDRFQTVFSNSVFEHVPTVDRLFHEIRRVLLPGGRLVFTVPSEHLNSMLRWPRRIRALFGAEAAERWQRGWDRRVAHVNLGGEPFWKRLIAEAGLELLATRAMLGPEIIAECERWQLRHFTGVGKANLGNAIRACLEGSERLGWDGPERATRRRSARRLSSLLADEPAEPGANLLFVAQRPA